MSTIKFEGSGPGAQTKDGCSVEFYRLLKPQGEPEIISATIPKGASILELGCGVGRITHPLVEMRYSVTAVDNSAEMLAHVKGAKTICSDIEKLYLNEQFDLVLLMSHMINFPNGQIRNKLLTTCKSHQKKSGITIIQCHPYDLLERIQVGFIGNSHGINTYIDQMKIHDNRLSMTIRWCFENKEWSQSFNTVVLNQKQIEVSLERAELRFIEWIDEKKTMFTAQ